MGAVRSRNREVVCLVSPRLRLRLHLRLRGRACGRCWTLISQPLHPTILALCSLLYRSLWCPLASPPLIRLQSSLRWIWNVNDLNYLVERFTLLTAFVEELFFSMEKAQCMLDFADNSAWSGSDAKPPCRCGCS